MISKYSSIFRKFLFLSLLIFNPVFSQTLILNDPLQGNTVGSRVGGSFTSDGYKPGTGTNHILYNVPAQIPNGYVEFEMKGFSPSDFSGSKNDHAFLMMYDGRGVGNVPSWGNFRDNYFRWNFHWRQSANSFKSVVNCAAPTSKRLNSTLAVFKDEDGDGSSMDDRDWFDEPNGSSFSWNKTKWYKVKVEWKNKTYKVYVDGRNVWSNHIAGLYDYNPKDFKIWLGSGVDKYNSDVKDVVYRNFKVYSHGGTTSNFLTVSPSSQSVSKSAGKTTFSISSNVSWSVSDNASWLSVSPTSGSNNGTVTANFTENTSSSSRTGTITVSGSGMSRKVTVVQEGSSTTSNYINVTPSNKNVSSSSGQTTFSVSSNVSWSVSDNASWMTVSPSSGSNGGTLTASFSENTNSSSRTGIITVSGSGISKQVTVVQAGQSNTDNYLNVPATISASNSKGETYIDVSANVSWSVKDDTKNPDWLNKSPKTGVGDGRVKVTWEANTGSASRTGNLIFSGGGITKTVKVVQGESTTSNYLNVTPSNKNVSSSSGKTTFSVSSNVSWSVSDNASWMTVSPSSGSNNGTVTANFTENTNSSSRTGTITISGSGITKNVTVVQAGKSSTGNFLDVPASINVSKSKGETYIDVSSNVSWSVKDDTKDPDWLNKSPKTGTGNGRVKVTWAAYTGSESRTGHLIFTGGGITKKVAVIQGEGTTSNYLNVSSASKSVSFSAGNTSFSVSSNISWSVTDNAGWMTVSPISGSNGGTVTASFTENTTSSSRTATITVSGSGITKKVTVVQGSKSSTGNYIEVPETFNIGSSGGSMYIDVSSNLSWSVKDDTKDPDWLNKSPKTGTGNGRVKVSWEANRGVGSRTGNLIFTGGGITKYTKFVQTGGVAALSKSTQSNEEVIEEVIPTKLSIVNYPNPFNPTTTINYSLPEAGYVNLIIFNSIGEKVVELVSEYKNAGVYSVNFNAESFSSGIYYSQLRFGNNVKTSKMIFME